MTTRPSSAPKRMAGDAGKRGVALLAALFTALPAPQVLAQAPAAAPVPASAPAQGATPAPAQADDPAALVARIALYPDDLVAIILPASTNPLQIVQAERFLAKRKTDPKAPIDEKWDDAVKSLVNYPEVITMMSGDLDWTAALGEAVVADQAAVLEAVQAFRRKTQAAGNLKSDEKQTVVVEKEVITIQPTDPQVIYVPQYNPTTVVVSGYAGWGYYPSPYPVYYYPYAPGAAFAAGLVWGAAMGAIWSGGHYVNHYGSGDININRNTNVNVNNSNISGNRATQNNAGGEKWSSGKQKGQVSKSVGANPPSSRVGDSRGGGGPSASTGAVGGGNSRGGAGASAGTMDRGGGGGGAGGPSAGTMDRGGGGGGAFDGYSSGRSTQMDSSRGASSRSASPSASSRGASPSAASRGGGGASRGGGGGGRRR